MDKKPQKNNKAVPERGIFCGLCVDHTFFCSDLYGHQDFQQPPDGSLTTLVTVDETTQDVPRQSLDHEVSGVDDAVDHGSQFDRLHHLYGVGVALVGMYVGLLGQSNRQR